MADQAIVLGVCADPEPDEIGAVFEPQSSVVQSDPDRPESTGLLEMERRMPRVFAE
jgi:hypothetical protein